VLSMVPGDVLDVADEAGSDGRLHDDAVVRSWLVVILAAVDTSVGGQALLVEGRSGGSSFIVAVADVGGGRGSRVLLVAHVIALEYIPSCTLKYTCALSDTIYVG
jgi:hypothetical protein